MFSDGVRDGAIRSAGRPRWVPQVLPVMLALLLELSVATGCRPTPQVPATNFVYSAALLTAANTKSQNRLQAVRQLIDRDHTAGLIGRRNMPHTARSSGRPKPASGSRPSRPSSNFVATKSADLPDHAPSPDP